MKFLRAILFGMLLAISGGVYAKNIGYINQEEIATNSLYAKDFQKKVEAKFSSRIDVLDAKEKALKSEKESLDRDHDILAQEELEKRAIDLQKKARSFAEERNELKEDLNQFQVRQNKKLMEIEREIVAKIAKSNKLDYVVEKNMLIYSDGSLDYTFKVVEELDKHFKQNK